MNIFKWNKKEKAPKAPKPPKLSDYEIAFAKKPEPVQRMIEDHPDSWFLCDYKRELHWVRLIQSRPKEMAHHLDLTTRNLKAIIADLDKTASHKINMAQERTSQDVFKLQHVQNLVDYSIALRNVTDVLMKKAIENGSAYYDTDGTFKLTEDKKGE